MRSRAPRLIFDGNCGFCRRWVLRWEAAFGGRVECRSYQEVAGEYPEVPDGDFRRSVHFFDGEGGVFRGAEAVLRALALVPGKGWMLWLYEKVPGWSRAAEAVYGLVARHRTGASRLTRWLVGRDLSPPTWFLSRRLFLALLGVVYAVAFLSLWRQVDGLIGSAGIQPAGAYLDWLRENVHAGLWRRVPTLFWLDSSDRMLGLGCGAGVGLALVLVLGIAPRLVAFLLWLVYLSFFSVGRPFLSFQWDVLLLESGLLAVVWAPPGLAPFRRERQRAPSTLGRWLLLWLLFRLMLLSGLVKLASGDEVWWNLTALDFHYWTQPLPHRLAYYAHRLPEGFQRFSVAVMFVIELAVPFLVFGPRRAKQVACAAFLFLMALISATGNYGFFNLLTAVLCVPLLDDRALRSLVPLLPRHGPEPAAPGRLAGFRRAGLAAFAALAVVTTSAAAWRRLRWRAAEERLPALVVTIEDATDPFASFNAYGLFADMTEERPEIVVEGSTDGVEWIPYRFRYKPGDVRRPPVFAGLHMPRLDWQMWFAALRGRTASPDPWYANFLARLLEGSEPVLALLDGNPFPEAPPSEIRSTLYLYTFSSPAERAEGIWWHRERVGAYCPTLIRDEDGTVHLSW